MKALTFVALSALIGLVAWTLFVAPEDGLGRSLLGDSAGEPTLAVEDRTFEGVAWIGEEPDDPREPGRGIRVVMCIDPGSARSLTCARRLVEIADQLGDVTPIWLTRDTDRAAAERFFDETGARAPLLLGATRGTLERFRLFQAPALRAFDAEGREIARSMIPLAARARDAQ